MHDQDPSELSGPDRSDAGEGAPAESDQVSTAAEPDAGRAGPAAVDPELAAIESDLDSIEAVLQAIDRDDLDTADEIVSGLDSGEAEAD